MLLMVVKTVQAAMIASASGEPAGTSHTTKMMPTMTAAQAASTRGGVRLIMVAESTRPTATRTSRR